MTSVLEDTSILDETILDSDCPCEYKHKRTTCTVVVTHRLITCTRQGNVCATAAEVAYGRIPELRRIRCNVCGKPAAECWQVRPV